MADFCTIALTIMICLMILVVIAGAFGVPNALERIANALERIADALEKKNENGKPKDDPCLTCVRWYECEGVDRESCPLQRKDGE